MIRTLVHVLVANVSGESSSRAVAGETSPTHLTVWTVAADTLRPLTVFVVAGTDQRYIVARTGGQILADGAVLARRVETGVDGSFATLTGEGSQTAAAERFHEVLTGSVVETRRGRAVVNVSLTVATYVDDIDKYTSQNMK